MEKFDSKWLRENGIASSAKKASDGGKFQIKDGDSIITVDKAAEKRMLDIFSRLSLSSHRYLESQSSIEFSRNNKTLCAGNPHLIEAAFSDLNSRLDSIVETYLGD